MDLAFSYGLAPLLFRRLKSASLRARVPAEAWERLRRAYFHSADQAKRRSRKLHAMLQSLKDHDIPVVVLKGACIAESIYADPALRTMCDVDLLVHRTDLRRAQEVLLRIGCGPQERDEVESISRGHKHLEQFLKDGLAIEAHWSIVSPSNPFRIDHAGLWSRAQSATVAGVEVRALCAEDLMLHLCLHMAYDHAFRIGPRPLFDLAELIRARGDGINWPVLVTRAREWRAERYAGVALGLAEEFAGASIPDGVTERLAPRDVIANVVGVAREQMLKIEKSGSARFPDITGLLADKRPRVRLAQCGRAVFPSGRVMAEICRTKPHSLKMYAGYASRLGQAVAHYSRDAWRILRMRRWLSGHGT